MFLVFGSGLFLDCNLVDALVAKISKLPTFPPGGPVQPVGVGITSLQIDSELRTNF